MGADLRVLEILGNHFEVFDDDKVCLFVVSLILSPVYFDGWECVGANQNV